MVNGGSPLCLPISTITLFCMKKIIVPMLFVAALLTSAELLAQVQVFQLPIAQTSINVRGGVT
jgi:hypothetical protein